ncbi:MAG: hypothetical protein HY286_05910 [Planctomycetes bacterium]|nr:hypothetical protein [Planctomycetota bacterium]
MIPPGGGPNSAEQIAGQSHIIYETHSSEFQISPIASTLTFNWTYHRPSQLASKPLRLSDVSDVSGKKDYLFRSCGAGTIELSDFDSKTMTVKATIKTLGGAMKDQGVLLKLTDKTGDRESYYVDDPASTTISLFVSAYPDTDRYWVQLLFVEN